MLRRARYNQEGLQTNIVLYVAYSQALQFKLDGAWLRQLQIIYREWTTRICEFDRHNQCLAVQLGRAQSQEQPLGVRTRIPGKAFYVQAPFLAFLVSLTLEFRHVLKQKLS